MTMQELADARAQIANLRGELQSKQRLGEGQAWRHQQYTYGGNISEEASNAHFIIQHVSDGSSDVRSAAAARAAENAAATSMQAVMRGFLARAQVAAHRLRARRQQHAVVSFLCAAERAGESTEFVVRPSPASLNLTVKQSGIHGCSDTLANMCNTFPRPETNNKQTNQTNDSTCLRFLAPPLPLPLWLASPPY